LKKPLIEITIHDVNKSTTAKKKKKRNNNNNNFLPGKVIAYACNPSTWESDYFEFEDGLVYRVSSITDKAGQRNSVLKNKTSTTKIT
jgi:hypothetical protein